MTATAQWSLADHIKERQSGHHAAEAPAAGPTIADVMRVACEVEITRFGAPGLCPTCDAPGYVRSVDVRTRATFSCCRLCGTRWTAIERRSAAR